MLWGGYSGIPGKSLGDGAAYDPVTNTWSPITMANAPSPRARHVAVWTGKVMFVHAGYDGTSAPAGGVSGGLYDPVTDTWESASNCIPQEASCGAATAQFTGKQVVVSGGGCSVLYTPP